VSPALILLQHLRVLGVALVVDGAKLKIRGSKPVLTDELLGKIRAHKPILLALLSTPTAPTSVSLCDALPHNTPEAAVLPSVLSATVRPAPPPSLDLGESRNSLRLSPTKPRRELRSDPTWVGSLRHRCTADQGERFQRHTRPTPWFGPAS
jgi:hypothetical protein